MASPSLDVLFQRTTLLHANKGWGQQIQQSVRSDDTFSIGGGSIDTVTSLSRNDVILQSSVSPHGPWSPNLDSRDTSRKKFNHELKHVDETSIKKVTSQQL